MRVKVIDNFLSEYQWKKIKEEMMALNPLFPWYYNDGICYEGDGLFQFTHTFYNANDQSKSYFYPLLDACQNKLGVKKLRRIKANLNTRTVFHRKTGWHIDYSDITTSVYYINTNNGWTDIKGYGRVKSVANRMVIFDSNLEHCGNTCTDEKIRVMVNFNYEE
tara:strand:+ start:81 stop:569 length:489 start_codon:yes stop_codon:yes gene_type:complete